MQNLLIVCIVAASIIAASVAATIETQPLATDALQLATAPDIDRSATDARQTPEGDLPAEARIIKSVIASLRKQVRQAVAELLLKLLNYSKGVLDIVRIKILMKLSKVTLAHIFHAIFDGVPGFLDDLKPIKPIIKPSTSIKPLKVPDFATEGLADILTSLQGKPNQTPAPADENEYSEAEEEEEYDETSDAPISDSQTFLQLLKDQYLRIAQVSS